MPCIYIYILAAFCYKKRILVESKAVEELNCKRSIRLTQSGNNAKRGASSAVVDLVISGTVSKNHQGRA